MRHVRASSIPRACEHHAISRRNASPIHGFANPKFAPRDARAHSHAYARTRPRLRPARRRNARAIYTTNTSRARETPSARTRDADAREIAISPARSSANPSASVGPSPSVRALATTRARDRARERQLRNVLCVMHLRRRRAVALHGRGAVVCAARAVIARAVGRSDPVLSSLSPRVVERLYASMDVRFIDRGIDRSQSAGGFFCVCASHRGANRRRIAARVSRARGCGDG